MSAAAPGQDGRAAMNNVIVFINSIEDRNGDRERLERGVCSLLGQRSGEWFVSLIEETAAGRLWTVVVECPDGTRRTWTFGRESQDVAIVCATLERDLGDDWLPIGWRSNDPLGSLEGFAA
jgi:hypothetical protein